MKEGMEQEIREEANQAWVQGQREIDGSPAFRGSDAAGPAHESPPLSLALQATVFKPQVYVM